MCIIQRQNEVEKGKKKNECKDFMGIVLIYSWHFFVSCIRFDAHDVRLQTTSNKRLNERIKVENVLVIFGLNKLQSNHGSNMCDSVHAALKNPQKKFDYKNATVVNAFLAREKFGSASFWYRRAFFSFYLSRINSFHNMLSNFSCVIFGHL